MLTLAGFAGVAPCDPLEFSIPAIRNALLDYIRDEKLERPVVIGHSMGGVLANALGAEAPGTFKAIVAVDGLPFLPVLVNPTVTAEVMKPDAERIPRFYSSMTPDQPASQSDIARGRMVRDSAQRTGLVDWARLSDPRTSGLVVAAAATTDLRPDLHQIKAPVLVIGAAGFVSS